MFLMAFNAWQTFSKISITIFTAFLPKKIDLKPKDEIKEGNTWGQQYLEKLIGELVELKIKAKQENNPILYNQLQTSLMRAHEVQSELNETSKNH